MGLVGRREKNRSPVLGSALTKGLLRNLQPPSLEPREWSCFRKHSLAMALGLSFLNYKIGAIIAMLSQQKLDPFTAPPKTHLAPHHLKIKSKLSLGPQALPVPPHRHPFLLWPHSPPSCSCTRQALSCLRAFVPSVLCLEPLLSGRRLQVSLQMSPPQRELPAHSEAPTNSLTWSVPFQAFITPCRFKCSLICHLFPVSYL